jgi:PAS domain S-box-containing protein
MVLNRLKHSMPLRSIRFQLYAGLLTLVVVFGVALLLLPNLGWPVARASIVVFGILLALLLTHMAFATFGRAVSMINTALTVAGDRPHQRISEIGMPAELLALARSYNAMSDTLAARQRELHDQSRRTALLTQLSIELHASLDPALLVSEILRTISANTNATSASIILAGPDGTVEIASTIWDGQVSSIESERVRSVLDSGLAGWVLRHGRNVALGDVAKDARWISFHDQELVSSVMAVPLTFNSATLGVLTVTHPAREHFTSKDLLLLVGVAAQASVAISAAQRYAEERRRQEQALLLFSMSQFLTAERSAADLAAELLEKSGAVFDAYRAALFLADQTTGDLELFAARAAPRATNNAPPGDLSAHMAATAKRAWQKQATIMEVASSVAGASADMPHPDNRPGCSDASATDAGLVCVALPLLHNGAAIGAFVLVARAHDTAVFPARVWSLLTIFTNVAAVAFANRQLVDQLQLRTDLLDRQVAERTIQLQHSRDMLRVVFDSLPDGLVLMDTKGSVLSANDAWCQEVLNLQPQAAVGRQYPEIIRDLERRAALVIERPPSTGAAGRVRCTMIDGRQRWYETDRYAVNAGGADSKQVIERWRDVTLQEALQRRLLLQEQLTSLGRLATSIVHEVGNPLQGVRSCLDLCREDATLPTSTVEYLDLAVGELERIGLTLDRLRELYNAPRLAWEQVDLNQLLRAVQQIIAPQLRMHQIDLDLRLTPELPPVYAQPDALRQVLLNLMLNAQAAMPHGGTMHVALDSDPARRMSYFRVVDTGVGISAERLKQIFEPFQRQDLKPGLGLYLSHLIIQQHQGDITLTSTVDAGTSVTVSIPWSEVNNDTDNRVDRR